jgi:hypothetical protein
MANCVCEIYGNFADFHTAVEAVDDAKFLASFVIIEGTKQKFVIIKKT